MHSNLHRTSAQVAVTRPPHTFHTLACRVPGHMSRLGQEGTDAAHTQYPTSSPIMFISPSLMKATLSSPAAEKKSKDAMTLTMILRALRVTVSILTLAISGNNVYLPPSTFSDHVNTLLAPTFTIAYTVTLCTKVCLVGPYLRAALMILPALLWYSTSMSRPDTQHTNLWEPMIRMDTFLSFPTSIIIVLECILTLRWEARRKRLLEAAKAGPLVLIENRALIPTILPPEEQDNVEVVIPVANTPVIQSHEPTRHLVGSCLIQMPEKVQQAPTPAYFPTASNSASSSSHREQQRHRQQQRQRVQPTGVQEPEEERLEEANNESLPPYTR